MLSARMLVALLTKQPAACARFCSTALRDIDPLPKWICVTVDAEMGGRFNPLYDSQLVLHVIVIAQLHLGTAS